MCLCYYLFFLGCKNNIYLLIAGVVSIFFENSAECFFCYLCNPFLNALQ